MKTDAATSPDHTPDHAPAPSADAMPETVVERLRRDIFYGRLEPGTRLKQIVLERRYGCTRIALRQALDAMTRQGLVVHEPMRGYSVATFDRATVKNLTEARAVVEAESVVGALPHVDADLIDQLTGHAERFRVACETGTTEQIGEANMSFHRTLMSAAPNPVLAELAFELRQRLPIAVSRSINTPERMSVLADQHFQMIEALKARDAATLRKLVWDHIAYAGD
ncbi:MAG: hypothetical protein CMH12_19125 [Maritimibacter sp.]|nr:hypothetical protein [Maritimibacter sp.]